MGGNFFKHKYLNNTDGASPESSIVTDAGRYNEKRHKLIQRAQSEAGGKSPSQWVLLWTSNMPYMLIEKSANFVQRDPTDMWGKP